MRESALETSPVRTPNSLFKVITKTSLIKSIRSSCLDTHKSVVHHRPIYIPPIETKTHYVRIDTLLNKLSAEALTLDEKTCKSSATAASKCSSTPIKLECQVRPKQIPLEFLTLIVGARLYRRSSNNLTPPTLDIPLNVRSRRRFSCFLAGIRGPLLLKFA